MTDHRPLIEIKNLYVHFHLRQGLVRAVEGVTLSIEAGQIIGLVGESGCGKSVTSRTLLRIEAPGKIVAGEILLNIDKGQSFTSAHDNKNGQIRIHELDAEGARIRSIRGKKISMVFQEPMTSLGPMHTIGNQVSEAIRIHHKISKQEARQLAIDALKSVRLPAAEKVARQYPHQLSGGMRQRCMIAMALSCRPQLLVADEPTTALDVSTEAQILDLLRERQASLGMAVLYITHNLAVVSQLAHIIVVMYLGKIVEQANTSTLFHAPKHPYTRALLQCIPRLDKDPDGKLTAIAGTLPDPYTRPAGCTFHPRCPDVIPGLCDCVEPGTIMTADRSQVACHLYSDSSPNHHAKKNKQV